jgi:hypothetical protein
MSSTLIRPGLIPNRRWQSGAVNRAGGLPARSNRPGATTCLAESLAAG